MVEETLMALPNGFFYCWCSLILEQNILEMWDFSALVLPAMSSELVVCAEV